MSYPGHVCNLDPKKLLLSEKELQEIDLKKPFRPHLVLGRTLLHGQTLLTVVPFQSNPPGVSYHYKVEVVADPKTNGLLNDSWILCSQILTVNTSALMPKRGELERVYMDKVLASVRAYLRIPCNHPQQP
ncbi:MAG: type II toxin-antitoxin system PemK/MazF family toxin [Rhodocyclaceae bacterium]|nr:type II toxin-antitoxin system PemK/MazF family toxin [Rhodocyclaceae bacterium]